MNSVAIPTYQDQLRSKLAAMPISVAIPTRNRPDDLEIVVQGLMAQSVIPEQLIVVDQSLGDESEQRVTKRLSLGGQDLGKRLKLTYIRDSRISGLTAARNRALDVVIGGIVLFLDDDVVLEPNFIEEILKVYRQFPHATGVSGIVTNYSAPPRLYRFWIRLFATGPLYDDRQPVYWRATKLKSAEPIRVTRLGGGLMSFRVDSIKGFRFDEHLTGACDAEDVDFTIRLGAQAVLLIAPCARLVHNASTVARPNTHWLYKHAKSMWYLYRRTWNRSLVGRVCFLWMNVGYIVACSAVSLARLSVAPWRNLLRSIRESHELVPET